MSLSRAALRVRNSSTIAVSAIPSTSALPILEIKNPSTASSLRKTPLPIQSTSKSSTTFLAHKPLPQTHGIPVAILHLRSHTSSLPMLTFFSSFALRSASALNLPTSNLIALPTKTSLYTVPRSPFAHKKSQENFWKKEHKRAIKVYDGNQVVVERWLAYLRANAIGGVGMRVQTFTYKEVGYGKKMVSPTGTFKATSETSDADNIAALAAELIQELSLETESMEDFVAPIIREGEIILGQSPRLEILFRHESPIATPATSIPSPTIPVPTVVGSAPALSILFSHRSPISPTPLLSTVTPILTSLGLGSAPALSILFSHKSPIALPEEVEKVIEKIVELIPAAVASSTSPAVTAEKLVNEAVEAVATETKKE